MIWRCPNCHAAFDATGSGWRCLNGHSFDRARQGYINLLLPNQKNSSDPGDNRDMVEGRRNFLEEGHYQPLAEAMAALLQAHVGEHPDAAGEVPALLDLGCGEGYYLRALSDLLPAISRMSAHGLDISREAVKRAATSLPIASLCIASSYRVPVADASVDVAIQVFAPVATEELRRILTPRESGCACLLVQGISGSSRLLFIPRCASTGSLMYRRVSICWHRINLAFR
jgi:23S rRNA (guanine745-N1)-methyltransferase